MVDLLNYFFYIFTIIFILSGFYMLFQNLYTILISFWGFGSVKRDYELLEDKTRFLILVAAHNEESVIENTINNLSQIDYDSNLYDIYIVNDNSTDSTGELCDQLGFKHIDTIENIYPREGVGKPGGLQYALRYLGFEKLLDKYDVLMVLDADNHVDKDILKELNSQWISKGKPEAIQSYLGAKNSKSFLSCGYATSYWITNRFFQLAKYKMGLPNCLGGTGFLIRLDWLIKENGFLCKSLTDDLETQIKIVENGGRILWNHLIGIYDEKPDNIKISIRQRTRWSQGHWFVAFKNYKTLQKMFLNGSKKEKFKAFDQLLYLFGLGKGIQLLILIISMFIIFIYFLINKIDVEIFFITNISLIKNFIIPLTTINVLISIYCYLILPIYAFKKDKKKVNYIKFFIGTLYFGSTYAITQLLGLIKWKKQGIWVKTPHKHQKVSCKEIKTENSKEVKLKEILN